MNTPYVVVHPWVKVKVQPWATNMHFQMEMNTHVDMVNPLMVVNPWVKVKMQPWAANMHLKMEMNTHVAMVTP
jgi:hypothetical protein